MIITKLQGGLGNQMFQYAFGKLLGQICSEPVYADTSYSFFIRHRPYALDAFQLELKSITPLQIPFLYPANIPGIENHWLRFYQQLNLPGPRVVTENKQYKFDRRILQQASKDQFLIGFWQHYKYLEKIEKELRTDFTFKQKIPSRFSAKVKMITSRKSVAIHIRRGDYLRSTGFESCPLTYYQNAIKIMDQKIKQPHYFIFSDDMKWSKEHFSPLPKVTFIDGEDRPDTLDLQLMQMCKHHIIANSTFSWWGAWLGYSTQQLVIMPMKWSKTDSQAHKAFKLKHWMEITPR
jgi:hypothetical protein